MRPGPGARAEDVERNQRERLFGAMVATVAEKGYEATTVGDLVRISGVSSRTFYDLFDDKAACFLAAIEAMIELGAAFAGTGTVTEGSWRERAERGMDLFANLIVAQPAAARMCLIDVYAAGPEAEAALEAAIAPFEALTATMRQQSTEQREIPEELVSAYFGGMQEVIRTRLYRGTEGELPGLLREILEFTLSYRRPPEPLRRPRLTNSGGPELLPGYDHEQRVLHAFAAVVAEQGYQATTVADVVKRAGMSTTTFYANFTDKQDALMAAIESGGGKLLAAVTYATGRSPDWPHAIGAAFRALFSYLASEPAFAHLIGVEVYVAGVEALEHRERVIEPLEGLLDKGYERSPETPPVAKEAIAATVSALVHRQIRAHGAAGLPVLAPLCTYIALAPFVGPEEACAVANEHGGGGRRRRQGGAEALGPGRKLGSSS